MKNKKELIILTAALVLPGGFVALGIWKAYEIYRKRQREKEIVQNYEDYVRQLKEEAENNPE